MTFEDMVPMLPDGVDFKDISTESYREYTFPGGDIITIESPVVLHVSESGGHYIVDNEGIAHYIPYKWIELSWDNETGKRISFVSPRSGR